MKFGFALFFALIATNAAAEVAPCCAPADSGCASTQRVDPGCILCSDLSFTGIWAILPLQAATFGRTLGGPHDEMALILTVSAATWAALEATSIWATRRARPLDYWVASLAIRGAAILLTFYAARELDTAGFVLVTAAMTVASAVPSWAFKPEAL